MAYCSAPLANGYSPTELLMQDPRNNSCPSFPAQPIMCRHGGKKQNYSSIKTTTPITWHMKDQQPSNHVRVKDMQQRGTVVSTADKPRSYIIETSRGSLRRNRFNLSPTPVAPATPIEILDQSQENTTPAADPVTSQADMPVTPEKRHLSQKQTPSCQRLYPARVRTVPVCLNWENVNTNPEWILGNNNSLFSNKILVKIKRN